MNSRLFYISELIQKKMQDSISPEEDRQLTEWINSSAAAKQLFEQLNTAPFITKAIARFDHYAIDKNRAYLLDKLREIKINEGTSAEGKHLEEPVFVNGPKLKQSVTLRRSLAFAASIIGLVLFSVYLLTSKNTPEVKPNENIAAANDIQAPDKNRALIKLGDGRVVYLDSVKNGTTVQQPGMEITKTADGKIEYKLVTDGNGLPATSEVIYNTLSNPRGSKVIDIQLEDGSNVWLNAGSVISYPVVFNGSERRVEIEGEAYFEVAKNNVKPFVVMAEGTEIKVLGTHFNVNAYTDEKTVKTTLLEGSVRIIKNESKVVLAPGQQASVEKNGVVEVIKNVNTEEVMAWKNGAFYFDGSDIHTVMRQVARWYDVSVVYEGKIPGGHYRGKPSRDLTLSQMLKVIEYSGVQFKVDGRKVIIKE